MSLTREASMEQMWGSFPALRVILEKKRVPDHYYGPSSVCGQYICQLSRLLQLTILIRENKAQITEALRANRAHKPVSADDFCRISQLKNDLSQLRSGYGWASKIFQDAAKELDEEIGGELALARPSRCLDPLPYKSLGILIITVISRSLRS